MRKNNPPHRHKQRIPGRLARRQANKEPYDKVLIVCEGEATEPNYFNGLIRHHRISSTNVEITGIGGSSPKSVVELAEGMYEKEKQRGDAFDKVFCVFDKDSHTTYQGALDKLHSMDPPDTFVATTSVPAFEYWLLLHYEYSTRPYTAQLAGRSAGAQVLSDLKKHFPAYTKGHTNIFFTLRDKLEIAKANAVHALRSAKSADTDDPSTKVHELVEFLQNIKS